MALWSQATPEAERRMVFRSLAMFVVAGVCEIGGSWLI